MVLEAYVCWCVVNRIDSNILMRAQTLRLRIFGDQGRPRRRLSVRLLMYFDITHDLKASRQKARSPALTLTQVWRPERLKRVGPAMKLLIFHWI